MQGLFKVAISLFLVIIFTFTTVVKPATALSIDFNVDNESMELYETAKKVGQTAIAITSATSAAAGLSGGAGIMSSLAGAGAVVGGGAIAGIGVLGAGPTAVTTMLMDQVLRDDENLASSEREARAVGRRMTAVGATAASAGAASAIAVSGSVTGLSAAGITSGLAAIGTTVGGGMAAGATITIAAPAVAAAAVGYGGYQIWKQLSKD
ncbi:RNA polymerase subunit sigma-24 [Microcoleus sp. FACHB-SPT15]|uniref:RNA polymerase subunit sigma-24 n=1 Tax=Microcoleus sp. FACHB-SPT15 TaxID=2692830 RepID=UPI0018F0325C|nr:RNA polymerase subunit sigma-24 [Microcoleus sp. FACHB-SPT15]